MQSHPRCTKYNSPSINGQCTNFILFHVGLSLPLNSKVLISLYIGKVLAMFRNNNGC